ncbi:ABC transporter substrate-binding protein [Nocardioides zeae]|uniref:ABC transporter substrate-binding protein n=1 Tax=Nocardioides imazamoxiresistens TaxID=3231893 RepID=A0ABU3PZ35_9ACTN|nr:ABC transporter substrate-binding protein [Nocardioides zeae]MDT9594379.1 ABC transporter substrate-binding protein [Nocardioides zeae]
MRRRAGRLVALALTLALAASACTGDGDDASPAPDPQDPVAPAPVALGGALADVDGPVSLGVLVSTGAPSAEGGDLAASAEGAVVARERVRAGGGELELVVRDDRGDAATALDAVGELADAGVAGIVLATTGPHVVDAVAAAAAEGLPVVLPYGAPGDLPTGAWSTAPSPAAVGATLTAGLADLRFTRPYVVSVDGALVDGVEGAQSLSTTSDALAAAVGRIEAAARAETVDSVVVAGPPRAQAQVAAAVQALSDGGGAAQGTVDALPVALTPQALAPSFATELAQAGGVLGGQFLSAGPDATDATTLSGGTAGDSAAAYFAALRTAAADTDVANLLGDGPFGATADAADLASHDAVVALVRAVEEAGTTEPAAVADALGGLALDSSSGLAGAPLDFTDAQALPDASVVLLTATTDDPGVRPAATATPAAGGRLYWFAAPGGE